MLIELEPWRQEVDAVGKEVLGTSIVTLNRSWCRRRECNMGSWACDGFLEEVSLLTFRADIAVEGNIMSYCWWVASSPNDYFYVAGVSALVYLLRL